MMTALRAGWLWDGTGRDAIRDGVVLVVDRQIAAVGRAGDVRVPPEAELIERPDAFQGL